MTSLRVIRSDEIRGVDVNKFSFIRSDDRETISILRAYHSPVAIPVEDLDLAVRELGLPVAEELKGLKRELVEIARMINPMSDEPAFILVAELLEKTRARDEGTGGEGTG